MKRLSKFFAILFVMILSVSTVVFAEEETLADENYVEGTKQFIESYFAPVDYDDCRSFEKSQTGFIKEGYESYKQYVENDALGTFKGFGESKVEDVDSDTKKCEIEVIYEKKKIKCIMEFKYVYSPSYKQKVPNPESITFASAGDDDKSFGDKMADAGKNTLIGMFTVVVILLLISAIISLFKFIPIIQAKLANKEEKKDSTNKAIDNTIAQIEEKEELVNDLELVAVITAAIAASTGTSSDGFVVRSIRRARRK